MKKKLTFLGIETSCDETAASVVQENSDGTAKVLSNVISCGFTLALPSLGGINIFILLQSL